MAVDYDVAISFLAEDEGTARNIASALAPLRVFVYSNSQERLVGREGIEAFRDVFLSRALLCLVLLRPKWGTTQWTRVEEEAIKDRCFTGEHGQAHAMFVKMERSELPKWASPTRLYLDFATFGIVELVGAVKARCMELGAELRPLSAEERARRVAERERFEVETAELIRRGAQPLYDLAVLTLAAFENKCAAIETSTAWVVSRGGDHRRYVAFTDPVSLVLGCEWLHRDAGARLVYRVFLGQVPLPADAGRRINLTEPQEVEKGLLKLVRVADVGWCWEHQGRTHTPESAAELLANALVDARTRQSPP